MEAAAGSVPASMATPRSAGSDTRQGRRRREVMRVFRQEELVAGKNFPPGDARPFKRGHDGVRRRGGVWLWRHHVERKGDLV
jgi:hypothetical protein